MKLEDWFLRFYYPIVSEFGYSVAEDAESTRVLAEVAELESFNILKKFEGRKAYVIGNAPGKVELSYTDEELVITAGKAVLNYDGKIDIHVTDLDEGFRALCKIADEAVLIVHAHGDNVRLVKDYLPSLGKVIGTTQYMPFGRIVNPCGFTDGDRAALIASSFARDVELVNFDFSTAENEVKLRKLKWARRILEFEGILRRNSRIRVQSQ